MIPQLLSTAIESAYLYPKGNSANTLVDYEQGGVGLNDPSEGWQVKLWTLQYISPDVIVSAPGVSPTVLFSRTGITEISLAFDQNMNPFVAFVENGRAKYWWYDTVTSQQTFSDLSVDAINPKCTLDDKRPLQSATNDILLIYKRGTNLCMRVQRDRYETEYVLREGVGQTIDSVGMGQNYRLQIRLIG